MPMETTVNLWKRDSGPGQVQRPVRRAFEPTQPCAALRDPPAPTTTGREAQLLRCDSDRARRRRNSCEAGAKSQLRRDPTPTRLRNRTTPHRGDATLVSAGNADHRPPTAEMMMTPTMIRRHPMPGALTAC